MVVYNAASKELTAKIVYYGPGFGGKTTNLQFLHRRLEPSSVGNLLTLAATADRTIFFDLLPVELGDLKGYRIRFQVATVPGQSPYNETRRVVLRGADGVVFVVDSRWSQLPKNLESLQNLKDNLKEEGIDPATIPFAVQFNKRDLPDVLAVDALQEGLGLAAHPFIEAVASEGKGVVETFKLISKLTFVDILRRLQKKGTTRPARPTATETESLSAWKSSILHGKSTLHPEVAPQAAASRTPAGASEPLSFPEGEDMSATRAIPIIKPRVLPGPESPTPISPFPFPEAEAAAAKEPSVFEPFDPFPQGEITEDTTPEFFEKAAPRRTAAATVPPAEDRVSTAGFAVPAVPEPEPPDTEITAPMSFPNLMPDRSSPPDVPPAASELAPEPPLTTGISPLEERMIQLAVASTWGDRLSAVEEKLAALSSLEEKLAAAPAELDQKLSMMESRLAERTAPLESKVASLEAGIARAEAARGWEKDVNLLRNDWANARLAAEGQLSEMKQELGQIQQNLAESSGREMELVARVSRESLTQTAAIGKIEHRIRDTEEKFSQLVIDHESRMARRERLLEEQSGRAATDHEALRRTILELEENHRKFREESEERHHGVVTNLESALQTAREDSVRHHASAEDLRRFLSDALTALAARLKGDSSPE